MRFLDYSRSSVAETISHTYVALDQEYIKQKDLTEAKQLADVVWKKINNFITYLNKTVKRVKL
jgi:four helix bundle protein